MSIQQGEILKRSGVTGQSSSSGKHVANSAGSGVPTYDQIAARARAIWKSKGCPPDRDQENWREAEAELRRLAKANSCASGTHSHDASCCGLCQGR